MPSAMCILQASGQPCSPSPKLARLSMPASNAGNSTARFAHTPPRPDDQAIPHPSVAPYPHGNRNAAGPTEYRCPGFREWVSHYRGSQAPRTTDCVFAKHVQSHRSPAHARAHPAFAMTLAPCGRQRLRHPHRIVWLARLGQGFPRWPGLRFGILCPPS